MLARARWGGVVSDGAGREVWYPCSGLELMLDEQPVETTLFSLDQSAPKKPVQRRKSDRHLSLLRVGSLVTGEHRELCLIKNVSAGGMLIRTYSHVEPGTHVSIEHKQGEPLSGSVLWNNNDCIGVAFDVPVDVLELISVSVDGPRQRLPRVSVQCTAWIREGATVHRTKTVNVSQGGLRIVSREELPLGTDVIVSLNGLSPIPGVLRWKNGDDYGISFNRSVALHVLVNWLREQQEQLRLRAAG